MEKILEILEISWKWEDLKIFRKTDDSKFVIFSLIVLLKTVYLIYNQYLPF